MKITASGDALLVVCHHPARFHGNAELFGRCVPRRLIRRLQRNGHVEAAAKEQRHIAERVADSQRLNVGYPILAALERSRSAESPFGIMPAFSASAIRTDQPWRKS
jgi:hypothetical protein